MHVSNVYGLRPVSEIPISDIRRVRIFGFWVETLSSSPQCMRTLDKHRPQALVGHLLTDAHNTHLAAATKLLGYQAQVGRKLSAINKGLTAAERRIVQHRTNRTDTLKGCQPLTARISSKRECNALILAESQCQIPSTTRGCDSINRCGPELATHVQ